MMRMIAKNERLTGRIEEFEKLLAPREATRTAVSYASVTGRSVVN